MDDMMMCDLGMECPIGRMTLMRKQGKEHVAKSTEIHIGEIRASKKWSWIRWNWKEKACKTSNLPPGPAAKTSASLRENLTGLNGWTWPSSIWHDTTISHLSHPLFKNQDKSLIRQIKIKDSDLSVWAIKSAANISLVKINAPSSLSMHCVTMCLKQGLLTLLVWSHSAFTSVHFDHLWQGIIFFTLGSFDHISCTKIDIHPRIIFAP